MGWVTGARRVATGGGFGADEDDETGLGVGWLGGEPLPESRAELGGMAVSVGGTADGDGWVCGGG